MPQLVWRDKPVQYVIKRSKKAKTARITVDAVQGVEITVPVNFKRDWIDQILNQKAAWITDKMNELSKLAGCPVPRSFTDGDIFYYLGDRYNLQVNIFKGRTLHPVLIKENNIRVAVKPGLSEIERAKAVRQALVEWYSGQAKPIIIKKVDVFSHKLGVKPARVKIKEQKSRWGSCSGKGNINLNWKIIMAPPGVIDYVIVHELCHLIKLDHSPEFWRLVESVLPDWEKRRRWLKEYGPVLNF
ncbi:hypothetical protein SAMN05660706_12753 [Desulfoscipio geothermicus DSM 3669]|uniref:YgjP-like metallopeptidase domain-containing protein n=1 Tax=Desulfoscipio geothermicus DSM 3669 TaxID=1121426 RepID=A0A1I6E6M1_9FIRM|nr:hypothetical protein SAMN05660706_12753 [Desulfoscipio geothermicus DSM 3669]